MWHCVHGVCVMAALEIWAKDGGCLNNRECRSITGNVDQYFGRQIMIHHRMIAKKTQEYSTDQTQYAENWLIVTALILSA